MLVAVVSVKGSPGVTTFCVALAARWPTPLRMLLVETDPSGGDIGTRFSLTPAPGLMSLAAATRRSDDPAVVWQHAQPLPGGLPVVGAPPDADRARAALSALLPGRGAGAGVLRVVADAPDAVVIADCGRIDAGSAAMPIVGSADVLVLLTRARADDLAHVVRRLPQLGGWSARPVMLLVGNGYSEADVARELGIRPLGRIPEDRRGAAVLCGRPSGRRWAAARSPLGRTAHTVATALAARQSTQPIQPGTRHEAQEQPDVSRPGHPGRGMAPVMPADVMRTDVMPTGLAPAEPLWFTPAGVSSPTAKSGHPGGRAS